MNVILPTQNSTSPSSVAGVDTPTIASRATPTMAIREFFFSMLSEADRKRTDIGWNTATRRFNGFIRFVSNLPARTRGTSASASVDLVWAAREGDIPTARSKIAAYADINHADSLGMTAIMYAAQKGNLGMVHTLITADCAVNIQNKEGKTPLLLAIEKGEFDVINYLIESGADLEKADQNGCTPLMYAARYNRPTTTALLLSLNVKAAVKNKEGWTALMLAARYGHQKIATTIIKEPTGKDAFEIHANSFKAASDLNQFAVIGAMFKAMQQSGCSPDPVHTINWAFGNKLKLRALRSFAYSGLRLTQDQFHNATNHYKLDENYLYHLRLVLVDGDVSSFTTIKNFHANNQHSLADGNLYRPVHDVSDANPLDLIKDGISHFSTFEHSTDSTGQYRHAIGMLRDVLPKPDSFRGIDSMLEAGWRSHITQIVSEAQEKAETAAAEAATLLANPKNEIFLTDQEGNKVLTDSIQFKETLLAFDLRRNEYLPQLAELPEKASGSENKLKAAKVSIDESAKKAQAQAILASNEAYVPLKLHMPSSMMLTASRAKAIEAAVKSGSRTDVADALAEVDAMVFSASEFFAEVMDVATSDLARHWFIDELTRLLDEMSYARASIASVMPHQRTNLARTEQSDALDRE